MSTKHVVILKNDAVGDLVHSLNGIYNIINDSNVDKITIFVSKFSKKFNFLLNNPKVKIKIINYNLSIIEKIKLFFFIFNNKISKIYILAPKNFFYYLPIFFFNIKFYALCVDNINGYKRPSSFLRRFLYKFVINDRAAQFKRLSTKKIQSKLTSDGNTPNNEFRIIIKKSDLLKKNLPDNYIYFHAKRKILNELGWGINELKMLFGEILKYSNNLILTKDIENDENTKVFKDNFNSFDFKTLKFIDNSQKVIFFDNVDGVDLYNTIINSKKVVAFHGMMTNLATIEKKPVLDLFYCNIKSLSDYRRYKNALYEFKPNYKGYDLIVPSKDIIKTINKMRFSLKKIWIKNL